MKAKEGNECKTCSEGEIANDEDGLACGDGTDAQSCFTCKDGSCGNQCEASSQKVVVANTGPDFVIKAIANFQNSFPKPYFFRASFNPFIDMELETGEECCQECTPDSKEPKEYKKFSGAAGVQFDVKVSFPLLGGTIEMPPKTVLGFTLKAELFATLAGANITGKAQGSTSFTAIDCKEKNCGNFSLDANFNGTFGPQIDGKVELLSCNDPACEGNDDPAIVAVSLKGGGTFNVKGFVGGQYASTAECGNSCIGAKIDPIFFKAHVTASLEILFKKISYSASTGDKQIWGGTSVGGC